MKETKKLHVETLAVHGGQEIDPVTLSLGAAVWRTSAYGFHSAEHASNVFSLAEDGYVYSRLGDPTTAILEKRMALLEGGVAAVATASGTAAIHYTVCTLARSGDEIVSASNLYGGTHTMFKVLLKDQGICVRFADVHKMESFRTAITPKTRLLFVETAGNPSLDVADIASLAKIAHEHHIPLVVDATFTPPSNYRPIEDGADIVIHSLSKWIGGHGSAIGGIMIDSGKFDWKKAQVPLMQEGDENYHGMRWAFDLPERLAQAAFALRFRFVTLRNLGACLSPDNAWFFIQGLESLFVRMAKHNENALRVAQFLHEHPKVQWVRYPGLESDISYETAKKQFKRGFGGMVVFGIKESKFNAKEAGKEFINRLELFSHVANVGDVKSLAIHSGSTTHSQLSDDEQKKAGMQPELIRLSIGIEHIDDIIADITQALEYV